MTIFFMRGYRVLIAAAVAGLVLAGCSSKPASSSISQQDSQARLNRMIDIATTTTRPAPKPRPKPTAPSKRGSSARQSLPTASPAAPAAEAVGSGSAQTGIAVARGIFGALSASIAGGVAGFPESLIGFGISAIANAFLGGDSAQVAEIESQLQQIQNQLNVLQSSVYALEDEVEQASCYSMMADAADDITTINEASIVYQNMVQTATSSTTYQSAIAAMNGGNPQGVNFAKLYGAISDINSLLTGSGQSGAIAACAAGYLNQWASYSGGEARYYQALHGWLSYYTGYQVLAMQLWTQYQMTELAAAVNPDSGTGLVNICKVSAATPTPTATAAGGVACTNVLQAQNQFYDWLQQEWFLAGAGYSTVSDGAMVGTGTASGTTFNPGNLVWLTDLNDFQAESCTTPLNSRPATGTAMYACGGTVGTTGSFANSSTLNMTGWHPATAANWQTLLTSLPDQGSSASMSAALASAGFQNTSNLIILTGDTVTASYQDSAWDTGTSIPSGSTSALCFIDTSTLSAQPEQGLFCDGYGQPVSNVMNTYCYAHLPSGNHPKPTPACPMSNGPDDQGYWGWWTVNPGSTTWTNPAFYAGWVGTVPGDNNASIQNWGGYPFQGGYLPDLNAPMNSYRWPVATPLTAQTGCGGYSATNAAGVTSACGDLYAEWLYSVVLPQRPGTYAIGWQTPVAAPGATVTGTLNVANLRSTSVSGVSIGGALPAGTPATISSVTSSDSGTPCLVTAGGTRFTCGADASELGPYASSSLTVQFAISANAAAGPLTVIFGANSTADAGFAAVDYASVQVAAPGLSVLTPAGSPQLAPASAGTAAVTIANNSAAASPAQVTVAIGPSSQYAFTISSAPGGTCSGSSCSLPGIPAGATTVADLTYQPKSPAGVTPGTKIPMTFTVTAGGQTNSTTINATVAPAGTVP